MTLYKLGLLLITFLPGVLSEIRTFNGRIDATSKYIHYSDGYIIAPGYVSLNDLVFTTVDDESNKDDDVVDEAGSTVDIVLFHEPSDCANSRSGCDWTELGIGASDPMEGLRWCCSDDAVELGLCEGGNQYGRLIVNVTAFSGLHRFIPVPPSGKMESRIKYGKLEEPTESGKYVLVLANCDDAGRDVMVTGDYTWMSSHGYLPGNLVGAMYFFIALTVVYFVAFCWYGLSMRKYEDSIIPIQKWILLTIGMGFLETFFKTGDYLVWNVDGTRFWFAMYIGVAVGVLKRGISRCLILVVSLGWGVARNDLSDQMKKIWALGIIYVGTAAARDIMALFAVTENQVLSIDEEEELVSIVTILAFVVAAVDVTFYLWILDSLNGTMQYLEEMNQQMKLQRYLRLRCILLFSILFAVIWSVFGIVNSVMDDAMFEETQEWAILASWEFNYLFVLVSVAILWKPNPSAKDYAFVMELPAMGGDGEFEGTIPSANDDEDEEDDSHLGNGYTDDDGEEKLKVDDAVDA